MYTWALASETDPVLEPELAFLYLSIVCLTLKQKQLSKYTIMRRDTLQEMKI